jgi:hypothetical protein
MVSSTRVTWIRVAWIRVAWIQVSSMRWGGGQSAVGLAGQPPAPLMHRPVVGPAHQGQIREVSEAAVQPVPQVMGLAPGQGPVTAGEHTAAVAHGQGAALGGLDDPGGPAHVQGLAGRPAQHCWQ